MIRFTMFTSVEEHEARQPVERGRAREVLKGQCARAVIELAQFLGIRREPNLPQDRDGLIAEDSGDVSRRHERLKLAARGAVRRHGQRVGVGLGHRQHAVDDRRGRPDRRRNAPQQTGDRLVGIAGARGNPGENGIDASPPPGRDCPSSTTAIASDPVVSIDCADIANARVRAAALERLSADHVVQEHLLRIARVLRPLIVCGHRVVRLHELARVRILQHQILEV